MASSSLPARSLRKPRRKSVAEWDGSSSAARSYDLIARRVSPSASATPQLVVIFRVVRRHILDLGEDLLRLAGFALGSEDAGALELHRLRRVPALFGFVEGLQRVVVFPARHVGAAEEERRERPFGLFEVFDGQGHMAEVMVDDAELEMELLLLGPGGRGEPLLERIVDVLERADLVCPLAEPLAQLRHHAAFEFFALDEQRLQIDQLFGHGYVPNDVGPGSGEISRTAEPALAACRWSTRRPAENVRHRTDQYTEVGRSPTRGEWVSVSQSVSPVEYHPPVN